MHDPDPQIEPTYQAYVEQHQRLVLAREAYVLTLLRENERVIKELLAEVAALPPEGPVQ